MPRQESTGLAAIKSGNSNPSGKGMYRSWGIRKRTILLMGVIPRYVQNKPFTVMFHDSSEWESGFQTGTWMGSRQHMHLCCCVWTWYKNFALALGSTVQYSQHQLHVIKACARECRQTL
jgi:hypothetical protein